MKVSLDQTLVAGYVTPNQASFIPRSSWSRVKDFFSCFCCCKSRSVPVKKRITPSTVKLRENCEVLYPFGVIEKSIGYGNLKFLKNESGETYIKFSESRETPRLFKNEGEFAKYLKGRGDDVSIWKIFDTRAKKWIFKYWDDIEEILFEYSSDKPLFYAICKDSRGAFKLIDIKKKTQKYIVDCSGYCTLNFISFETEKDFLKLMNKKIEKRNTTSIVISGLLLYGAMNYLFPPLDTSQ